MSHRPFPWRVVILSALVILTNLWGNFLLSLGMKDTDRLWDAALLVEPQLVFGVLLLISWLLLRLALLSATEMSLVLPFTAAIGYILTSLVGQFLLRESVTAWHNMGLALIAVGAVLVGASAAPEDRK
jgi:multidrug transporter EmrE-like cation transporter